MWEFGAMWLAASGQPQMLVVGEVEEPYAPVGGGLLVPMHEHLDQITTLLEALPAMFQAGSPDLKP